MDINTKQVIIIALVMLFGLGMILKGYTSGDILGTLTGIGSLIVGIAAAFTEAPKVGP